MANPLNANVIFYANHEPPLKDGLYSLSARHSLKYDSESKIFNKTYSFAVSGERFSLNDNVFHKVFPPANSQGHFYDVLPHVVLSRRTLPWERVPDARSENSSWLAILVFTESTAPTPATGKLANLCPADCGGLLPKGTHSYGSDIPSGKNFLNYGESANDPCVYIDIPKNQFATIAPSLADLAWNAHARTLTTSGNETPKDYATVVANRLPVPGTTGIAHLVSLENLGSQLPQDDGSYTTEPSWTIIRLVSLKSWSFHVSPLEASFAHILQGLNAGVHPNKEILAELGDCQLRLPSGHIPTAAISSSPPLLPFDSGYSVLSWKDGAADKTAWYRGPCTPSIVSPPKADSSWTENPLPTHVASKLVVSVSTTPADDVSLAAAWQLGRLLALADRNFATAQLSWKRDARLALNTKLGRANKLAGGTRAEYARKMRAVLADAEKIKGQLGATLTVTAAANELTISQYLVDWLGRLALLSNVPVEYFIPDTHMLPPESLKFFNLNPRWLACLLDGAWSLDRQPEDQWAFDTAYQPWKQILDGSLKTSFVSQSACWPASGVILNSQLIPDYWPGIEFVPDPSANILREETLGSGTLMAMFDQELTTLIIRQPPESIHFGFEIDENGGISKLLRYVKIDKLYPTPPPDTPAPPSGTPAPASDKLKNIPQRTPNVIQLDKLATLMRKKLGIADATKFTPAEFALELVETVALAKFTLPTQA